MSLRQSAASVEFVTVGPVTTGTGQDPTTDDVDMAFIASNATPEESDWIAAAWVAGGPPYFIQLEVCGDAVTDVPPDIEVLPVGEYIVWVRIHDNPEVPARPVDKLVMY